MKKKISLLLCILIVTLCFAGCAKQKENNVAPVDREYMNAVAEFMVAFCTKSEPEQLDYYRNMTDVALELELNEIGLKASNEAFISALDSWEAAEIECGEYQKHDVFSFEEKAKEVVLTAKVEFKDREADVSFSFDKKANLKSLDVSAHFSLPEILQKAALNTVLGMGVVFAVLIFLAFVIELLEYVPMLCVKPKKKGKKKKKKKKKTTTHKPVVLEESETDVNVEYIEDNLELIAVISAAIAAMEGTSTDGFVVRSIRRRPSNNWN